MGLHRPFDLGFIVGYMVSLVVGFVVLIWWGGMFGLLACVC